MTKKDSFGKKFAAPVVSLTIDGQNVQAAQGSTLLEAARKSGVNIPSLCYLREINQVGACRICVVEINNSPTLQAACVFPVSQGLVVRTNTKKIQDARRAVLELLLSNHPADCFSCIRNLNCELQALAHELNIREIRFAGDKIRIPLDTESAAIEREPEKCILCYRCVSICSKIVTANVYTMLNRGFKAFAAPAFNRSLADVSCTTCGQCVTVCPTAALREKDQTEEVWAALANPDLYVLVQTAPSIRVTIGEEFGMAYGTVMTGQMVSALRKLGFDKVFYTDFTADMTIVEEGYEFLEKLQHNGPWPHLSSCSPGWVKFCEHFYPEFLGNISTVKSPMSMFGALAKTFHAEALGIAPERIFVVGIMPCTAKKYEAARPELSDSGLRNVDVVLTTREFARMIRQAGLDFVHLAEEDFDTPLGESSGAGTIFGATGGVAEAAIRTIYEHLTGQELQQPEFIQALRGMDGVKVANIKILDKKIKLAIAHGTGNARLLLDKIKKGEEMYHFIEIMGCPGGCVGGGGQPILAKKQRWEKNRDYRMDRADALYRIDEQKELRRAHQNPAVWEIYEQYLDHPLSEKAKRLLHTNYFRRGKF
ncbi:MAG: [FeFe] hydrogenase, group A [Dethiobacter sp.]|jgi:iron-only hydrogenase group A|nr:[FeFe] hydrogenase, group A [Dethiobacter sp.]MBS3900286.1 [FeFe] hydrogenase, group A [Dethiobacter sp.]